MGKYIRGAVDEFTALGTLAAKDAIVTAFDETVNERTLISSLVATWSLSNFTAGALVGPIMVGVAHSDYSAAEIEEWIENAGSWDEGDLVNQEIAGRKIRKIGIFEVPDGVAESRELNDGRPIKTKLNWILLQGQTLGVWAYNLGQNPLATTDPIVATEGHANLWPR